MSEAERIIQEQQISLPSGKDMMRQVYAYVEQRRVLERRRGVARSIPSPPVDPRDEALKSDAACVSFVPSNTLASVPYEARAVVLSWRWCVEKEMDWSRKHTRDLFKFIVVLASESNVAKRL